MRYLIVVLLAGALVTLPETAPSAPPQIGDAAVFAPGVISGPGNNFAPAFSSDGRRLLFSRASGGASTILQTAQEHRGMADVTDAWAEPRPAGFSGQWNDLEPSWAPDRNYVVFASNRPPEGTGPAIVAHYYDADQIGGNLWRTDEQGGVWGPPRRLAQAINSSASVWTPSLAKGDVLYFMATDAQTGRFRLHRATKASSENPTVTPLPFSTGASDDVDPYITPDEQVLIFSSDRDTPGSNGKPGPERLFIVFHPLGRAPTVCSLRASGWEDPSVSMVEARLSRDRRKLYFASRRSTHGTDQPPLGPWDDGKSKIWVVPFTQDLWRYPGVAPGCRK